MIWIERRRFRSPEGREVHVVGAQWSDSQARQLLDDLKRSQRRGNLGTAAHSLLTRLQETYETGEKPNDPIC